jgi:hypothetical protein
MEASCNIQLLSICLNRSIRPLGRERGTCAQQSCTQCAAPPFRFRSLWLSLTSRTCILSPSICLVDPLPIGEKVALASGISTRTISHSETSCTYRTCHLPMPRAPRRGSETYDLGDLARRADRDDWPATTWMIDKLVHRCLGIPKRLCNASCRARDYCSSHSYSLAGSLLT